MINDRWMRASDTDREQVAELLCEAYAAGRLNREEFDERSTAACSALTLGELQDLSADLPVPPPGDLPSDNLARRCTARTMIHGSRDRRIFMCLIVLAAGIAGRVLPGALWAVAMVSTVIVFLSAAGSTSTRR